MRATRRACRLAAVLCVAAASPAAAQDAPGRRYFIDTVVGVQDFFGERHEWPTQVMIDTFAAAEIRPGLQVSVRPVLWRVGGEWEPLLDQLSVRYEARARVNWRIEAGRFPSPIGLGMTENRASLNAGILWCHRPYYMPLPSQGPSLPDVSLVSAVYPNGAQIASSSERWDVRAAIVDQAPVQFWQHGYGAARSTNLVVGGGVTPRQGLRVGAAFARGEYARARSSRPALGYRMTNVELDYAVGHTRVSGEWTRDAFESLAGDRIARGWTVQAEHAVTPRVFVHARLTRVVAPEADSIASPTAVNRTYRSIDSTVGIRLTPEVILRGAHSAIRRFGSTSTDYQVGLSLMWARRWW